MQHGETEESAKKITWNCKKSQKVQKGTKTAEKCEKCKKEQKLLKVR